MKLTLTKLEKSELLKNDSITVERECYIGAPKSSILHGKGIGSIFDKIDYCWVYGDTAAYIQKMMNVGRRQKDYLNNKVNTWSGSTWYEFPNKKEDEFGVIGTVFTSGRKDPLIFKIDDIFISELRKSHKSDSFKIIITAKLVKQPN